MSIHKLRRQFCVTLLLGSCLSLKALHVVGVDDNGFLPSELTINVGESVTWISTDDFFPHTTTSDLSPPDPNAWRGVLVDVGDTFSKTFDNPGVFTYRDEADIGRGTITVIGGGGNPPEIKLESAQLLEGNFVFDATGLTPIKDTVLETSTNLVDWTSVSTNVALDTTMSFTNPISAGAHFFRIYQIP